jgi:hypothetical protein
MKPLSSLGHEDQYCFFPADLSSRKTYDVRNLTERLLFCVVGLFMLAFREIDNDQFIRNVFFLADQGDKPGAGGHRETVEFEDHVDSEIWGVGKRGIETLRRRRQRRYMLARRLCVSAESMWIRVAE